jgi:hypothetical protein
MGYPDAPGAIGGALFAIIMPSYWQGCQYPVTGREVSEYMAWQIPSMTLDSGILAGMTA